MIALLQNARCPSILLVALSLGMLWFVSATHHPAQAQVGQIAISTTPSQGYFLAMEELYQGEYRDAQRSFTYEGRGAMKIGISTRWIDSICYHAMLGETYYHMGLTAQALEQFNLACAMYLQYPNWMLQVTFTDPRPDVNQMRKPIPWGRSSRNSTLGTFNTQMSIMRGDLNSANRALQSGGVVQQAEFRQVNVIEIVRTTALAIRRRNELLGPLAPEDATTRALVGALSRGASPPNHWSSAWVDLKLGLAYLGQGQATQAMRSLTRAERVAGRFDHPLTCVSLLEQGRLAMESGKTAEADRLLSEASYSAFHYDDVGIVIEAFRLMALNRLSGPISGTNPMLEPAAAWSRRERYNHLFAQLNLDFAEELMRMNNWEGAAGALKVAQSRMRDAAAGRLGNRSQYLATRVEFAQGGGRKAYQLLDQAVQRQGEVSNRNFQIGLANTWFDSRQLRPRSAVNVYKALLDDPTAADWVFRPLETLATIRTPQASSFDRWIAALLAQKDPQQALEVTDRAKRRHFHGVSTWGGKRESLGKIMEAAQAELSPQQRTNRDALLLRVPDYQDSLQQGRQLREQLQNEWVVGMDKKAWRNLVRVWRNWEDSLQHRDTLLTQLSLDRVPVELSFPPLRDPKFIQGRLQPGRAVLVFHDSPAGMMGFLISSNASTTWNCGPTKKLGNLVTTFLRDIGNFDATSDLTAEQLESQDWLESGQTLYAALLGNSSLEVASLEELIIVPDGLLWYVPFTALPVQSDGELKPLISAAKVRLAPTLGLAVGNEKPWKRVQHSAVVGTGIVPGDEEEEQLQNMQSLNAAVELPIEMPDPLPASAQVFASLIDVLVMLEEQELELSNPLGWLPLPTDRSAANSSLMQWSRLPQDGPQRMIFPGLRTIAERGAKASGRRGDRGGQAGSELFLSSCALMSGGAQTILLSRWRVGGKSTMEITREFVQELPYTSAAEAWQRSVELARELELEPSSEPRIKAGKDNPTFTAAHPMFWSGYLLIDSGAPSPAEADAEPVPAEAKPSPEEKG